MSTASTPQAGPTIIFHFTFHLETMAVGAGTRTACGLLFCWYGIPGCLCRENVRDRNISGPLVGGRTHAALIHRVLQRTGL